MATPKCYGAPKVLVSDGAGVFKANQAKAVYRALGIRKETIEKRKPWQNFVETTFNIQRRMADYHFRIYAEEGLARREVALWLGPDMLSVEFAGDTLARYEVEYSARTNRLREVKKPRLFETPHRRSSTHPRLFELDVLGEGGWLKALKMSEYALRRPRRPEKLQDALFPYLGAI